MIRQSSRRIFLKTTAAVVAAMPFVGPSILRAQNVGSKLNIASVGCGGKGGSDIAGVLRGEDNLVAICDVDSNTLGKAAAKYKGAKTYSDFREMLDKEKGIDAVTVSTPDHMHAPAAMTAIKLGKHVYVQKPLTHTIEEAGLLLEASRKYKVQTAMGNQGHSGEGWRNLCEHIWAGNIGDVAEVHAWTNRPIWPQGMDHPAGEDPVPANLNWDLWLGPAPVRPFKAGVYHSFKWRGWWDFGCGALGDMGCHILDGAFWSLCLGMPTKVELVDHSELKKEAAPKWSIIKYHFPARQGTLPNGEKRSFPACVLTWYDGGKLPPRPDDLESGRKLAEGNNGSLFVGSKGKMMAGTYGGGAMIFPEEKRKATPKPPELIPRVKNHHMEWVEACKGGKPASGSFEYAAPFTQMVNLGNLVLRVGKTIEWDAKTLSCPNAPEARQYISKEYRKGWEVRP